MRASSRIARSLYSHNFFIPLHRQVRTLATVQNNKHKDLEIMTLENMFQSIIVDDYMYKVNNAIQRVYGVKPIGSVFSDEELIHFTN